MKLIPGTPISIRVSEGSFLHCIVIGEEFQQWNVTPRPVILPLEQSIDEGPLIEKVDGVKPLYVSRWAQQRGVGIDYVKEHGLTFPPTSLGFVYFICFKAGNTDAPIFLPYNTVANTYNKSRVVREWADTQVRALTGATLPPTPAAAAEGEEVENNDQ